MKLFIILLLSSSVLLASKIQWSDNLIASQTLAKKQNKPLIVMLSSPYCHVCHMMKEKVFTDSGVIKEQNKHFISVKLEIDFDDIPEQFEVHGTPTFYAYDKNGKFINYKLGGSTLKGWKRYLKTHQK